MARREDYEHWSMGLPAASEALRDVDALCEELGLQRGEVCRLLVITWSKARRGNVQQLWGFTPGVVFASGRSSPNGEPGRGLREVGQTIAPPSQVRQKAISETAAAAVQGLDLD